MTAIWELSSSSCKRALSVVDGTGLHSEHGPHYSRRTPGSKTFTGVGQEVVLVLSDDSAVWAVVRQKTPVRRGTGSSRGRTEKADVNCKYVWRNMLFRNLGTRLSSELIREAVNMTYRVWTDRYGCLPDERLRTEVDTKRIRSSNPGYCYKKAGWEPIKMVGSKLYLVAPVQKP